MWEEQLKRFDKLINTNPNFERKGKKMIYTSANGYMFTLLNKAGEVGIRLSKESGQKFMEKFNTTGYKSHGATMRGYVHVPEKILDDLELLAPYLEESYQYVMSLKTK